MSFALYWVEVIKDMTNKEILYLAYRDEKPQEGFSYAIYLAGLLGAELRVILLERDGFGKRFDDVMSAITFHEANEHEIARRIMSGEEDGGSVASLHAYVAEKCREAGIKVNIHSGFRDTVKAIRDFLRGKRIDMVLLSPSVTQSRSTLRRLVKVSPQPVVTMTR